MADIVVAIACNLVALFILISGVLSAIHNGVKVTMLKLFMTLAGGVGAYFLTPLISGKLYEVEGVGSLLGSIGISHSSINSCVFMVCFLLFYAFTIMVCSLVKHCLIKSLRDKKLNTLKIKRAKSINPRAERMVRKAEWKGLKFKYKEKIRWYHRLISGFLGIIVAIVVGYVVIMPYGYIAKDIVAKSDGGNKYLTKGYEYTLNGLIGDKISNFIIHIDAE